MTLTSGRPEWLGALLRQAGEAHHRAFAQVNGEDAQWPAWYADWLHPRMGGLLTRVPTAAQLAGDLREAEERRQADSPAAGWPAYYAEWLIARYG